jgi:hypothetical protein
VCVALARFRAPAGTQKVQELDRYEATKHELLRAQSPLWLGSGRNDLIKLLEQATSDSVVRRDAVDFMNLLLDATEHGSSAANRKVAQGLLRDEEVIMHLRNAITNRRAQYRYLSVLRRIRRMAWS